MSNKKLNEALGISGNINDFLEDLDVNDDIAHFEEVDDQVHGDIEKIDNQISEYKENGIQNVKIGDIETSLVEIKQLIQISKDTIRHVYEKIIDSELPDSELIQALAKLMESTHITVQEQISLFKDRLAFYDKLRFEAVKHKNDMEKIKYKHDLDMEKLNAKNIPTVNVENQATVAYSQESVVSNISDDDLN